MDIECFAIRYNRLLKYKGHVWYDRFKSKLIQSFQQFVNTFIYICNNPIRVGLALHPLDFEYSAISYIKRNILKDILEPPNEVLSQIIANYLINFDIDKARIMNDEYSFQIKRKKNK